MSTEEYIQSYYSVYKSLRPAFSPALMEEVHFTSEGFNHLVYKKGHRRDLREIHYRLPLVKLIARTITCCVKVFKTTVQQEIYKGKQITATYYELQWNPAKSNNVRLIVIVKRRGKLGKLVFQSVMKQKAPRKGRRLA